MCRHEQVDGGRRHRGGNAAMRERFPDGARNVGVRNEFAKLQLGHRLPNRVLKRRPGKREREIESLQLARKVRPNLSGGFGEQSVARFARSRPQSRHKARGNDRLTVAYDQQIAPDRRRNPASNKVKAEAHAKVRPYAGTAAAAAPLLVGRS
ncbi:MAG: hypothetical protein JO113_08560 [Candidatus Eremiobacteraeota bacterium]|nr:hypothetical protein [Candidatus Eremiobacteraeota bacterium]